MINQKPNHKKTPANCRNTDPSLKRIINHERKKINYTRKKYFKDFLTLRGANYRSFVNFILEEKKYNMSAFQKENQPRKHIDQEPENIKQSTLRIEQEGYYKANFKLKKKTINKVFEEIKTHRFKTKGKKTITAKGEDLLHKQVRISKENGNTFWLEDMDRLVQSELFQEIAFEPTILSIAANYLKCPPIHVQTNIWFSFPDIHKVNLSENAQLFHQDKEFIKFIKIFIYLNEVNEVNGPHCYVEASHIKEAVDLGYSYSTRLNDDIVEKLYTKEKIKKITGAQGSIIFGDTTCLHKGTPVQEGKRIILQLEYASSLYLSPITAFNTLSESSLTKIAFEEPIKNRITQNYDSNCRKKELNKEKSITWKLKGIVGRLKRD